MKIAARYSHLNGLEFLLVHKPRLWEEIQDAIASVDAEVCRTKISKEIRSKGQRFYSPIDMNQAMGDRFTEHGWQQRRTGYWVTQDAQLIRKRCT